MQPDKNTPAGTKVRVINDEYVTSTINKGDIFTVKYIDKFIEGFLYCKEIDGGWNSNRFEIVQEPVNLGDHVTMTIHGTITQSFDNGQGRQMVTIKPHSGETFDVYESDVVVTKKAQPALLLNESFFYGAHTYVVVQVLNKGNNLCLREGTTSDYKIVHNNDKKINQR